MSNPISLTTQKQVGPNNCWAACLSAGLSAFGKDVSEAKLDALFSAAGRGLDLDSIAKGWAGKPFSTDVNAAYLGGFSGTDAVLDFATIQSHIDQGHPILVGLQHPTTHQAHAVLMYGYNQAARTVAVLDPHSGATVQVAEAQLGSTNFDVDFGAGFKWVETLILS